MSKQSGNTPQFSLILRLLCGGYLVYTAWDLRGAFQESPLYIVSAIVFAVVGLVLGGVSLYKLIKGDYVSNKPIIPPAEAEEETDSKDCEEQLDD